jgi:Domain of unknown function (DUF1918)
MRRAAPGANGHEEVLGMQAVVGDRLHVHGNAVGQADKTGEIVEVHGAAGTPPYLVRFDDGHTGLCFPGPDAVVEHAKGRAAPARKAAGPSGGKARASSGGHKGRKK